MEAPLGGLASHVVAVRDASGRAPVLKLAPSRSRLNDAGWILGVAARPSPIENLGLVATAPIAQGEVVAVLGGRVINDAELREVARLRPKYNSAAIGEGLNILLSDDELLARGNHSCDPNLWMKDAVTLQARRYIAVGDELTIDYALQTAVEDWSMTCRCGTPVCRRVVRGSDWRRSELQERYRGHFSPFLERRAEALRAGEAGEP